MDKVINIFDFVLEPESRNEELTLKFLFHAMDSSNLFPVKERREFLEIAYKGNPLKIYDTKGDISLVTRLTRIYQRYQEARNKQEVLDDELQSAMGKIKYDRQFEELYNRFIVYPPDPKIEINELKLGTEDYPNFFAKTFWEFFTELRLINILANSRKGQINRTILFELEIPEIIIINLPTYDRKYEELTSLEKYFPESVDPDQTIQITKKLFTNQSLKPDKSLSFDDELLIFNETPLGKALKRRQKNLPKKVLKVLVSVKGEWIDGKPYRCVIFQDGKIIWNSSLIKLAGFAHRLTKIGAVLSDWYLPKERFRELIPLLEDTFGKKDLLKKGAFKPGTIDANDVKDFNEIRLGEN